jgi:hypothetical protein
VRCDVAGGLLDVAEVGAAVFTLGRRDAEERHLTGLHGALATDDERQSPRGQTFGDELVEAVLDDRHLAARQRLDLRRVDVRADHVVAQVGEAGAGGEPDVSGSDHCDPRHRPHATG